MKERGSALLTAIIIVMVLLSISGILLTTVIYQAKNESSEEKGLRAYYLAEAGIEYGISAGIEAMLGGTEEEFTLSPPRVNNPFGQGGWFEVTVTRVVGATSFTVKSTADYYDIRRIKKAEYEFGGEDDGGEDGDDGSYNCDDDVVLPSDTWITNHYYTKGSKVNYQGIAFYARENNTSQVPGVPGNYWQQMTKKWTSFNWYRKNDIVCLSGKKYKARENMMVPSSSNINTPGEVKSNNYWQELTNQWTEFNSFEQGYKVYYEGNLYNARQNMQDPVNNLNTPGETKNGNTWQELTNQWTKFNSYVQSDVVYYGDKIFMARQNMQNPVNNLNTPGETKNGNTWQELTTDWRSFNYYYAGDTVLYNAQWYRAKYEVGQNTNNPVNNSGDWDKISSPAAPVLRAILVNPISPSIKMGQTQTFTATAIYSNGSTTDVSTTANWLSSNVSIATMAGGVATGHATGTVTGTSPLPIDTPVAISIPISIPITASFGDKIGTGYLTVTVPTNPNPNPGTNAGKILWEKEVIE